MDNLKAHHTKGVELLCFVGIVPPCSSDFNQIEKMWPKMKAVLHRLRAHSQDLPDHAVRKAFGGFYNCEGWFHASGYYGICAD